VFGPLLAGPPEAHRPRQELRLERRAAAARRGPRTGSRTPRGDNHCVRAQQGRSRVKESPARSCGEAGSKLPAGLPAGCPARSRCTRFRETDGHGACRRPVALRCGEARAGARSDARGSDGHGRSGSPALRRRGPSETEPARSKDRRDAPPVGGQVLRHRATSRRRRTVARETFSEPNFSEVVRLKGRWVRGKGSQTQTTGERTRHPLQHTASAGWGGGCWTVRYAVRGSGGDTAPVRHASA
jgi:hypothetical protein